jgi:hypothetical protein
MFVVAYLWAMGGIARKSLSTMTGVRATIIAVLTAAAGSQALPIAATDLANVAWWLLIGVGVWFLIEWLVLAPARWWRDRERPAGPLRIEGEIQAGNQLTIWYGPTGETATAVSNPPATPQSPERSTHE